MRGGALDVWKQASVPAIDVDKLHCLLKHNHFLAWSCYVIQTSLGLTLFLRLSLKFPFPSSVCSPYFPGLGGQLCAPTPGLQSPLYAILSLYVCVRALREEDRYISPLKLEL